MYRKGNKKHAESTKYKELREREKDGDKLRNTNKSIDTNGGKITDKKGKR